MDRNSESNVQIYVKGRQQDKRVICFRSRTGYCGGRCGEVDFVLCKAGLFCGGLLCLSPVPWKSSRQDCVSERMGEPGFDGFDAFRCRAV